MADALGPLPHKRLDFEAMVFAAGQRPEKIGLQPWETDEVWERLKAAMRDYRNLKAAGQNTAPVEAAIIFYAGWLGHYVGDGSQPLHVTVQYNGWTGPNPNGYTTSHQIHHQFEGPFVAANIHPPDVQAKMTPPKQSFRATCSTPTLPICATRPLTSRRSISSIRPAGSCGAGTQESRDFTAARLAAGASMLRDMIYTAWIDSAQPVPDPYAGK
jgi:hypothetical protein